MQGYGLPKRASPRMRVVPRRPHCPIRVRSAHPPSAASRSGLAGPYPRHATCPTRSWFGPRGWPFGQRVGGWVIHFSAVVCTNSPSTDRSPKRREWAAARTNETPPIRKNLGLLSLIGLGNDLPIRPGLVLNKPPFGVSVI